MTLKSQKTVLVTGGAGYIGIHAAQALEAKGYEVIILDNLTYGHRELVEKNLSANLIVGNIADKALLREIFASYSISSVMHFAAFTYVGESVINPSKYYQNNLAGTLGLLSTMIECSVKKIVFSSTCATYGEPQSIPITEDQPQNPINSYGRSKLMVENILKDYDKAYDLRSVIFRYFNAAGADPEGKTGEDHQPETHLIPLVIFAILGIKESISIFGTDYPTPDGTCIRDYIHVSDLAQAHVLGLEYLLEGRESNIFNLGNGSGFSVKEVIETAKKVIGKSIKVIEQERRPGDPPVLVGSAQKAREILGWQPQYAELEKIINHAWKWHQIRHNTH